MSFEMIFVFIMIIAMLLGLLMEIGRPEMIVFSVLIIFLITGILDTKEALSGFSNEGMLTVALLFVVAGAIQKSGKIEDIMKCWLDRSTSNLGSMIRLYVPTSLISAFLNNTPIVVALTPIVKSWCEQHHIAPSKFLIPLSYATILGGTLTLMGSATNLVVHGMLLDYGYEGFSLFQLSIVGVPVMVFGLLYICMIGHQLLPEYKDFKQQIKADAKEYLAEFIVDDRFPKINHSVQRAGLTDWEGLYLVEIIRKGKRISPIRATTVIQPKDRLIFTGLMSTLKHVQMTKGLKLRTGTHLDLDELKNGSTQIVEAVVSHQSSLLSKSVKQTQFKSNYDAGVVAIHRNNERIQTKISDILFKPGDTLLLLAGKHFVEKFRHSSDFYVLTNLDTPEILKRNPVKAWFSIILTVTMIVLVSFGVLSMFKAMALAVVLLLITKTVIPMEAKRYIHFDVLLLIASSFGVGLAMMNTGLAQWIADGLLAVGKPLGLFWIMMMIYLLTNIFTELITNSAAAILMLPIGFETAANLTVDPMGFAVVITIAASASFATPIGYQTNLIVYGPGGYKFKDYIKIGTPLSLIVMVITVTIVYNWWF